jgi:hypothetical protein
MRKEIEIGVMIGIMLVAIIVQVFYQTNKGVMIGNIIFDIFIGFMVITGINKNKKEQKEGVKKEGLSRGDKIMIKSLVAIVIITILVVVFFMITSALSP